MAGLVCVPSQTGLYPSSFYMHVTSAAAAPFQSSKMLVWQRNSRDGGEWLFHKCSLAKVGDCSQNTKPSKSSNPLLSFASIFRNICYICALFLNWNLISNSHMHFNTLLRVNLLRKYPPTSVTQTWGITCPPAQLEHMCEHQHSSWGASFLPTDPKHSGARRKDWTRNCFLKERGWGQKKLPGFSRDLLMETSALLSPSQGSCCHSCRCRCPCRIQKDFILQSTSAL